MKSEIDLRTISLKKAYSSDYNDILHDFYIPVLSNSIEYHRLAGFFSSTSLAISARGIYHLIENKGIMKLIISPKLSKNDISIINEANSEPDKFIKEKMLKELEQFENECIRDHVYALGWMIANKKLEIKVAIVKDEKNNILDYEESEKSGIFHQKVGILKDNKGNIISFSGSINESATGWLGNIEEFKVFRNWEFGEKDYVNEDISKFESYWNNKAKKVKTIKIPAAVENRLIEIAPNDISRIDLNHWYTKLKDKKKAFSLYEYQKEAIRSWIQNGYKGIFEMATGTGKTFTALGCLDKSLESYSKFAAIITCPYSHLIQQWKREIKKFGIKYGDIIIADSSNPSWRKILSDSLIDISLGYKYAILILTTHATFSSNDFVNIIRHNKGESKLLLIADEVHGLGAEKRRGGLINDYEQRLGLSATPRRWFDDTGTKLLYEYFGDVIYEFGLKKAIHTEKPDTGKSYLTSYRYLPKFVSLSPQELSNYIEKTKAIILNLNKAKKDEEKEKYLENLFFKRANIIKNATEKYRALEEILNEINSDIKWTLIYCSPQQIDNVMKIVNNKNLIAHRFTMEEGVTPQKKYKNVSERDFILKKFAEKSYQVLVAMKCLDEGVDIPPARYAILMASSGNPREYIQRIGRVIRRYEGKKEAVIYDIIVTPSFKELPPELRKVEWTVFKKELSRYYEIAKIALNSIEAMTLIFNIKNSYLEGAK